MARRKVVFLPGHYYHVYNRGVGREAIFQSRENYLFLLKRVKEQSKLLQITVIAYCLMPNHFHLLLRQDNEHTISVFMQAVLNSYTKAFNKAYSRSGTLFEGRFKSIQVDMEEYLLHLCRYIHRNPLEAGLASSVEGWPFSNYLEWIGQREGSLQDKEFIRAYFPDSESYQRFVIEYTPPSEVERSMQPFKLD